MMRTGMSGFESSGGKNSLTCITKTALMIQHSAKKRICIGDSVEVIVIQHQVYVWGILQRLRAIVDLFVPFGISI